MTQVRGHDDDRISTVVAETRGKEPDGTDVALKIRLLEGQNAVFELVARGAGIELSLARFVRAAEDVFEDAVCAISRVDVSGQKLMLVAAPRVPESLKEIMNGAIIANCGDLAAIAAHRHEPVVITDILADPTWAGFRKQMLAAGFRAGWVQPALARDGAVLGVVTLFFPKPRAATTGELEAVDAMCALASIVIDHQKRAEALQSADQRFDSLAANLPGVIYQRKVTPDGDIRYTYISEGARYLFGVSPEEVLADPNALFECHGPEYRETFRRNLLEASRELRMWDVEAQLVTRDGSVKWGHAIARPRRLPDGSVVWDGIILDATRLKKANLELSAANRAKSEFLANMSHELRTPLNAILGFSEIMRDEHFGDLGNSLYREYAADIHQSGTHLLEVINDILDLAKIEAGKLELNEETIEPISLVESCMRLVRERADAHAITLKQVLPENLPHLTGDARKLKQTLINLLSNAVKFTPDGGEVTVSAKIDADGTLAITVTDTGIGIPEDHLAKVFDPFAQVDGGLDRQYEGTGLGLPLSKAMVELHDGELTLESTVGIGTTATLRLPPSRVTA